MYLLSMLLVEGDIRSVVGCDKTTEAPHDENGPVSETEFALEQPIPW
jgi:hypothetical protein